MRDTTRLFIPHTWQQAPLLPRAWIVQDRVWQLYFEPRNWNKYYSPSYERLKEVRQMSKRNVTNINVKRKVKLK